MTTPKATVKMMDEIVGYCTKCKLELNHRIVRVDGGKPKRALCLTCNNEHAYRKSAPAKPGEKKPRAKRSSAVKVDQEAEWQAKLEKKTKPPKPYGMDKTFLLDDHIEHQSFGLGLVISLIHPDKINVYFHDGVKTMKCGLFS